jgi:lipoprotein-releasing system ATP-binding protein
VSDVVLELRDIRRSFTQGGQSLEILKGVSLQVQRGEVVALLGPSGCGKTTLLQIAGLLENPTAGDVLIAGQKIAAQDDNTRTAYRRDKIGFVYQFHHLLPDFTALENLVLPQLVRGTSEAEAKIRGAKLLESVGLQQRAAHYPSEMSGGEQQRVAIARALVNRPAILLADEPTGNLDPATAENVFQVLLQAIRTLKIGALIVTHNHELAARMDRVLQLKSGMIIV